MAYEGKKPGRTGSGAGGKFGGSRDGGSRGGGSGKSFGGKSFGGKSGGFGGSRDNQRSGGGSFGDRPPRRESGFNDRPPRRDFNDSPRDGARNDAPRDRGSFGDRPKRDFNDRPPRRDFNDRPPRREGGFNDRPPRRDFGDAPRDRGSFGDRPPRREGGFNDRPPRRDFGDAPRDRGSFGDRPPRRDFNDRPPRREGGFNDRPPRRDFNDRPPRRDFGDAPRDRGSFGDRPKRDFNDRPPRREGGFNDSPPIRRDIGDDSVETNMPEAGNAMQGHELVLYGVHAVQAALKNAQRKIAKIWATTKGVEHLEGFHDETRHPAIDAVEKRDLERRLGEGAVHQGIAVAVEPLPDVFLSDILTAARAAENERHVVVVLDEVTDPHNVGAVLRSMSVFGAKAMIVHKRNAPGLTATMAKIATGAIEHVPMIPVVNLGGALEELKIAGFFCLGLDENADYPLSSAPTDGHIALVLGAEGEGLREKTRSLCDAIANIPALGEIKSLNVSNAAAIALYEATRNKG